MKKDFNQNQIIIGAAVALVTLVSALGLAAGIDRNSMSGREIDKNTIVDSLKPEQKSDNSDIIPDGLKNNSQFFRVPEGAIFGELGNEQPIILSDSSKVTTLVESPDPGFVEVGVQITRGGGVVEVNEGEFTLVTDDARVFTPAELIKEPGGIVFTINAEIGMHDFKIVWQRFNQVKLVLFNTLTSEPITA